MAVMLSLVIDTLLGPHHVFTLQQVEIPDYMKCFLQTLVIEIAEVHL